LTKYFATQASHPHDTNHVYTKVYLGTEILFLRQVDFAIACKEADRASALIQHINSKLTINVKYLGRIDRFNGIDITQTKWYVKLTCSKYLHKMLHNHGWLATDKTLTPILPTPLNPDKAYITAIETTTPPITDDEKIQLESKMGFKYCQVIGEVIYPCFKACPEISPAVIKLSQYKDNPAKEHYAALLAVIKYLAATIDEGISYWYQAPVNTLPEGNLPQTHSDNHTLSPEIVLGHPEHSMYDMPLLIQIGALIQLIDDLLRDHVCWGYHMI